MNPKGKISKPSAVRDRKIPHGIGVDLKTIRTIDHECVGVSEVSKCCCARYDVCVTSAELKKIIAVLPEAAKFCPHLMIRGGYASVFDGAENGLHAIDTHENGLCVFAFKNKGLIRCALHAVELSHGWPLGTLKPKMCVLWPLTFAEDGRTLTLHDGALDCACSSPRKKPSKHISPALLETIEIMGGKVSKTNGLPGK
jgi:hypothetical protein